jgi:hypothetical protein
MNPDPNIDEPKLDLTAKGIWQQLPSEPPKAYTFQFNLDNPVSPDGSCGSSIRAMQKP